MIEDRIREVYPEMREAPHISEIASNIFAVRIYPAGTLAAIDLYMRFTPHGDGWYIEDSFNHTDSIASDLEEYVGNTSELRALIDDEEFGVGQIVRKGTNDQNFFTAVVHIADLDRNVDRLFTVQFQSKFEQLNFISFYGKTSGTFNYSIHDFIVTGYAEEPLEDEK